MVATPGFIKRLFGSADALDKNQTDDNAQVANLKREFAEHPSRGLTPARLYQIIEAAEQGDLKAQSELFDDMEEKDPQIGADMAKRRQLAAELEWQIVPPDGANRQEKKAAEFAAEVFSGLEVEDLIIDLGAGLGHGWANLELDWDKDGNLRYMKQPLLRPHSWFRLNPDNQNDITLRDMSATGDELWPLGWVQHRHKAKPGYVARSGLHRMLVWPYLFQNYALGDLAELLEIYGIPAKVGKYPDGASQKEKATLLRAVTSLGHRAAGIMPKSMEIEFMEAADGKGDIFQIMLNWCERAKAKVILGGTLTSGTGEGTNTNALGRVHERGQQSIINSDVRQYAGSINRDLLLPLAALNFGITDLRRAPRFFLDTGEAEDYKLLSESLPVFVDMGAKIPLWWLHEKTRIPEAAAGEEALARIAPKPEAPTVPLRAALKALPPTEAVPSELIADQLAQKAAPVMQQWLGKVQDILDAAGSLDEARAMLLDAFDQLPSDELAQQMNAALLAAHAAGRYDLEQQSG